MVTLPTTLTSTLTFTLVSNLNVTLCQCLICVVAGNVGNTFSDILRGCSSLTSLRLSLPGHWDTKYLFRYELLC